jgi:hypothetical protein
MTKEQTVSEYTPRPGDIGLTQISGWGGRAIRLGQWLLGEGFEDYEHAYVVSRVDADGTVWIVEAMPGGAQEVPQWHTVNRWIICPDEYREGVARQAYDVAVARVPYSFLDYGALALHRFRIPFPGLRTYIENSGHMICSQLADHCADRGGWHLFSDGRWEGYVTPGSLDLLWHRLPEGARA